MRICFPFSGRMLRTASRPNVVLAVFCLGAVVLMWSRCQIGQLESRSTPAIEPSTRLYRNVDGEMQLEDKAQQEHENTEQERNENGDSYGEEGENINLDNSKDSALSKGKEKPYRNIEVLVNGETKIDGRIENKEVYIPFSFIRDYFEIEGQIVRNDFGKQFHVRHTSYEYFTPKTDTYDPHGSFLWFTNYNVDGRSRVKCITGVDEVPISTQWGAKGYKYPIQIAQYGLSHFSMMLEGSKRAVKVVDDCEGTGNQEWTSHGKGSYMRNVFNEERKSQVMEFSTNGSPESSVSLPLVSSSKTYVLSLDIFFKSAGKFSIKVEVDDSKTYTLVYDTSDTVMEKNAQGVIYGIGTTREWRRITRNLWLDLNKAIGEKNRKKDGEKGRKKDGKKRAKLRISEIQSLSLRGKGCIDNITLMEDGHIEAFLASARWLLKNQDEKGGWSIPVKRRIKTGTELQPGWYSAMAQGQAMSVLTRAYHITKNLEYLTAARRATRLFRVESKDNGVLAIFMNKFKWYEEYPMTPSLFVLNGFLYSLMGLYDLKMTLPLGERNEAEALFKDGMTSLRAMILMFDSGSGTIYDLRHLTMDVEPNIARWDYHATHVNQLTWLTMINNDPFYKGVLKRWQGYFKGIKAKHN